MLFYVGAGSFFGGVLRYLLSTFIYQRTGMEGFPWGVFLVNVIGCGLMGVSGAIFSRCGLQGGGVSLFVMTGILGGFITFSAFSAESVALFEGGHIHLLFLYVVGSVLLGIGFYFGGMVLFRGVS